LSGEHRSGASTETVKHWEGLLVDGLFPLQHYIGGDETGAVFITEYEGQRAAIKVVESDGRGADQLLSHWRLASKVSHPHLIRLWKVGRCQLDATSVAYLVMECAEENLGQVLSERALTPAEAKEMLAPTLDAIASVHAEGFVHGRLTPANIMAVNDCVKLSSDDLRRAGDLDDLPAPPGAFTAPEVAAGGKLAPAGDIWALGVTLVEALTQRRPAWTGPENELVLPDGVVEPFLTIVRRCLKSNAQQRATAAEIAGLLEGQPAAQNVSRTGWYAGAAITLVIVAVLALWLGRSSPEDTAPPRPTPSPAAEPANPPAHAQVPSQPASKPSRPPARVEPAVPASDVPPPAAPEPVTEVPASSPDVVSQVMPEVLDKARRSIQGKVNVVVRVHADAYGAVRDATLEPPPVSRYFSGVALKAVRRWKFRPVKEGEVFVPQDWTVRFEFTRADTKASVEHAAH
jgi:TonB family protein